MDNLYKELILKFTEEIFKRADSYCSSIYKLQAKNMNDILNKIAKVLLKYTILDSSLSLSDIEKIRLRKDFSNIISDISVEQFKLEKDVMKNIFKTATKNKYYTDAYIMSIGINFQLKKFTDVQIKEIVNKSIKNELWSDRLWNNKKELDKTLKLEIEKFLQGNMNVNKVGKAIKDRFNQNAYNTRRLVQTEVARCQNEVNDMFAQENEIDKQLFTATLDNRTSNICREYDGKIFDVNDRSKPTPPLHPFCRSCLINVPYDGWTPTKRKDNITKDVIDYKTYEEWLATKNLN